MNSLYTLADADLIPEDFETTIDYEGGTARIYVLPLKREGDKLIRINRFTVKLDPAPVEAPPEQEIREVNDYAQQSVLSSGKWFKLGIVETGVHKLAYNDLEQMGIDPSSLVPDKLGVFGIGEVVELMEKIGFKTFLYSDFKDEKWEIGTGERPVFVGVK